MGIFCPDSIPTLLGLFDPGIAPSLLYYSYLPIVLISLFFGFFVFFKSQYSLLSKYLLAIATTFSLFILNEIVQWIAVPAFLVNFGWLTAPLLQAMVWFFTIKFFYYFIKKHSLTFRANLFLSLSLLPIIVLLPSNFNLIFFDLQNCQAGQIGYLWYYLYVFQVVSVIYLFIWGLKNYFKARSEEKNKILFLIIGVSLFLLLFSLSNILGEILQTYEINLVGPIGMVLFIALLAYLIIQYKLFNIKLLAAQGLVVGMVILIGSEFFFIQNTTNRILTAVTLLLVAFFGWWLVLSVKQEVKRREEVAKLAKSLEDANLKLQEIDRQKTDFLSIASHQLRTPLSIAKGYIELIEDGAFGGKPPRPMVKVLRDMNESNERLVKLIDEFLDITRIEQGRTRFVFAKSDLQSLITGVVKELKNRAADRGLKLVWKSNLKNSQTDMDEEKIRHVIFNFVDNAIKYTEKGHIKILLEYDKIGKLFVVRVCDTGLGFEKEDQASFFQKFYRGKNVRGSNVTGTGLGIYVCKKFVEAHGGKVWAISPGVGKGSEFGFSIPVKLSK